MKLSLVVANTGNSTAVQSPLRPNWVMSGESLNECQVLVATQK